MAHVIRVRDVLRGDVLDLGPEEPALRGSGELLRPVGPMHLRDDGVAEWHEGGALRTCGVEATTLGDAQPGDRILVRLGGETDEEWWVCEVEGEDRLDGFAAEG